VTSFVVVYDACVLHPAPLRDLLIRLARAGLVRARWSERILDECFRSILERRSDLTPEQLARTRQLMTEAVPDCMVREYEPLVGQLGLPDADDEHVLAAAIKVGAQVIVTANLNDFPSTKLAPWRCEAKHPDEFVLNLIDLAPATVAQVVAEQAAALRNPPQQIADVLDTLRLNGLVQAVARLRELG
jgi:predicted nucleic acid-binding protein